MIGRKNRLDAASGFTLIEVLIALFLSSVVAVAALKFYESESNNLLIQQNVAETQQSLRASLFEVATLLRNAGANIPSGLVALQSTDANPDTLLVRYAAADGSFDVESASDSGAGFPINIALGSDLSQIQVGQNLFYWHDNQEEGEWFTVTSTNSNVVSGYDEIFHAGQALLYGPVSGDEVLAMQEAQFFIDPSDSARPLLMKATNGNPAQPYAENIDDFQIEFTLTTADTVMTLGVNDTAAAARIAMTAFTADIDYNSIDFKRDGRRRRQLDTEVTIRNGRN